ncbi:MAG: pentapeptide repeat-containing protein [Nitrospina sp.]|nr:pentapeptide repeat-containing protein [Nitrospina sp.]
MDQNQIRIINGVDSEGRPHEIKLEDGVVWEYQSQFEKWTFNQDLDFSHLIFKNKAFFKGARFLGKVDFSNTHFCAEVDFSECVFEQGVSFDYARFSQVGSTRENENIKFEGCKFGLPEDEEKKLTGYPVGEKVEVTFAKVQFFNKGNISFEKSKFLNSGNVSFDGGQYSNTGNVSFKSSEFENKGMVGFANCEFENQGDVSFKGSRFGNEGIVWFLGTQFKNEKSVNFGSVYFNNKDKWVDFQKVCFLNSENIYFSDTEINSGGISFWETIFANKKNVVFERMKILGDGRNLFKGIVFVNGGKLNLSFLQFKAESDIDFDHCLFWSYGESHFYNIQSPANGQLRFTKCLFALTPKVDFSRSQFASTVFEGGKFDPEFDWDLLLTEREDVGELVEKVKKKIKDEGEYFCEVFEDGVEVDFIGLSSESAQNLTFRLTNLSGAIFDGLTLSHVQLNSPRWGEYKGRVVLRQEITLRNGRRYLTDDEYRDLSDQYTQLKINLERQGHYRDSGKFHISEQELTRDYNWKHGKCHVWLLHSLYKWLSGYGEEPFLAIRMFFFQILFWSLAVLGISAQETHLLNDESMPHFIHEVYFDWGFLKWFGVEWFRFALEISTPFKGAWFADLQVGKAFEYIIRVSGQIFILAIQLPLMILAIRRWFKR